MSFLRWLQRSFLENPLVGRQLATQLTGPRLGVIFTVVTGVLLVTDFVVFSSVLLSGNEDMLRGGFTASVRSMNGLILFGLLGILLPLRVAGAIDALRADKSFEQLVVTGASPLRLHFGNWALGFLYALAILLVSLPIQVYISILGDLSLTQLAAEYGVLALYSNVILLFALGFGVLERERAVTFLVIIIVLATGCAALVYLLPPVFAWATPVLFFAGPVLQNLLGTAIANSPIQDPVIFNTKIPAEMYPFLLWGLLALFWIVLLSLGPSHRFSPGLNNFGQIVLQGDRRRRFIRKARARLSRRVELAFFYENRPRWLAGWDFPLRITLVVGTIFLLWGVIVGLCFAGSPTIEPRFRFERDDEFLTCISLTGLVLFFGLFKLVDSQRQLRWRERVWRWSLPRDWLLSACAVGLIAAFVHMLAFILEIAVANTVTSGAAQGLNVYLADWWYFTGILAIFFLNCHLFGKLVTRFVDSVAAVKTLVFIAAGAVFVGPPILAQGLREYWLPRGLFPLVFLSPPVVLARHRGFSRDLAPEGFEAHMASLYALGWQIGIAAFLVLVLVGLSLLHRHYRKVRARASALASTAAVACLLAFLPGGSGRLLAAPELPLGVQVTPGFDGQVFGNRRTTLFFTVVVKNPNAHEVSGRLHFETDSGLTTTPRAFTFPPGTTLPLHMTQDFSDYSPYFAGARLVIETADSSVEANVPAVAGKHSKQKTEYLVVSDTDETAPTTDPKWRWVRTDPLYLPEEVRHYEGADAIFVGPTDLSRWTPGQRRALYDYVRLGGTVIFFGAIDPASLKGAKEWETILAPRGSVRFARGGAVHPVETLEGARVLWELPAEDGGSTVPLLSARGVGLGHVGHLAVERLQSGSDVRWTELAPAIPPSAQSRTLFSQLDFALRDSTSMLAVLGYFALYVLLIGPGLFIVFRRKERRSWIPVWIVGVPVVFLLGFPVLHASLHLRPSYASLTRFVIYGPAARHGVGYGVLDLRSNGRQSHEILARGKALSAYSMANPLRHPRVRKNFFLPLELHDTGADDGLRLDLMLAPWSRRRVLFLGDVTREERSVGSAVFDQSAGRLTVEVSCDVGDAEAYLVAHLPGNARLVEKVSGHPFRSELSVTYGKKRPVGFPLPDELRSDVAVRMRWRPCVFLVTLTPQGGFDIESDDLAFTREFPESHPNFRPGSRAARELPSDFTKRDGKLIRILESTVILQEIELEIRNAP